MSVAPRSTDARRDWGNDDSETPILHVDMDSFFASVELLDHPELVGKAVIVGGLGSRGVVTSATYQARALGVRAGAPIGQARRLAPNGVFLQGRHGLYSEYSQRVMEILAQITPALEPVSIDEAFLDVSGSTRRLGSPTQISTDLRSRITDTLGLPASVGIASTKSVAKIASAHAKPNGQLLIPSAKTVDFLHSLPVGALWGVGKRTAALLSDRGIDSVAQLAHTPREDLVRWMGAAHALHLYNLAWGIDNRSVAPGGQEKSVSTERTFEENVVSREELNRFALSASHQCARRLRKSGLLGWTVNIKLRSSDFRTVTRARTLIAPTDVGSLISEAAVSLFDGEGIPRGGVRLAGVGVSGLVDASVGVQVLLDEDPKKRVAETTMDEAGRRYGPGALLPASLIERSVTTKRQMGGE